MKSTWIVCIVFLVIGFFFMLWGYGAYYEYKQIASNPTFTKAVVLSKKHSRDNLQYSFLFYDSLHNRYEFISNNMGLDNLNKGDSINIIYNTNNPNLVCLYHQYGLHWTWFGIIFSLICFLVGVPLLIQLLKGN